MGTTAWIYWLNKTSPFLASSQLIRGFFFLMNTELNINGIQFSRCDFGCPEKAGVYAVTVTHPETRITKILYVGSSNNIRRRTHQYTHPYYISFNRLSEYWVCLQYHLTDNYRQIEAEIIKTVKPLLNQQHKKPVSKRVRYAAS